MKRIVISLISFYQIILSVIFKNILGVNAFCKYSPTCSVYAKKQIKEKGLLKGGVNSVSRIISCRNFLIK